MSHRTRQWRALLPSALVLLVGVTACSERGDGSDRASTSTEAPASTSTTTTPKVAPLEWHRLQLGIANTYVLVRGEEVAIVDPGLADRGALAGALEQLGLGFDDVDHVLATHQHPDHAAGIDMVLTAAPDATGYAGNADVEGITTSRPLTGLGDGDTVLGMEVIEAPGHTPGSICLYDRDSGVLVVGDTFNNDGRRITGPRPEFTADIAQAEDSLRKLAGLDFETVLFGHGDPIDSASDETLDQYVTTL